MSDIEFYESPDGDIRLNVQLEDETVWLTQAQIAQLFGVNSQAITSFCERGHVVLYIHIL